MTITDTRRYRERVIAKCIEKGWSWQPWSHGVHMLLPPPGAPQHDWAAIWITHEPGYLVPHWAATVLENEEGGDSRGEESKER